MAETRIVFDSNFWFSIFHKNRAQKFLIVVAGNDLSIFSCEEQVKELLKVFNAPDLKGKIIPPFESHVEFIREVSTLIDIDRRSAIIKDYKDNYVYDLCVQSHSGILVTNDSHFDILKTLKRPPILIITVAEFWKLFS
ncbi:MAG TPA: putative toxin-antitoxin system toxin component, PIN family [Chitinophagales bacterium]|nr:putative toxin-antitoxin system toxin component, PIN family [Chitinophagales bacterium]